MKFSRLALLWLVLVGLAAGYLAMRVEQGLTFGTDLLALLPREDRDPARQRVTDAVTDALSRQILVLVGNSDRERARRAAAAVQDALKASGLVDVSAGTFDSERIQKLGAAYFPYRAGL